MGRKVSLSEFVQRNPLRVYARAGLLTDISDTAQAIDRFRFIDQALSLGLTLGEIHAPLRCVPSSTVRIVDRRHSVIPQVEVTQ